MLQRGMRTAIPECSRTCLNARCSSSSRRLNTKTTSKRAKTGPNEQDMHLEVTRKLTGSLQMKEPTVANLVHILHGESATDTGASYTANAALPSGLVVGDIVHLPGDHVGISSLVLKDSTGSPVTLTLGTHYSLWDADAALVKILSLTTITQPIKAFSYTYKDSTTSRS
jgi:hypothetical protein